MCSDSQFQQLDFVELFSKIPVPDLLQIVKNIQQAITIRCIEFDEDVQVHQESYVYLCSVKALYHIFMNHKL